MESWIIDKVDSYSIANTVVWYEIKGQLYRASGSDSDIKTKVTNDLYKYHGLGYYYSNHNVNEIVLNSGIPEIYHVTSLTSPELARELVEQLQ